MTAGIHHHHTPPLNPQKSRLDQPDPHHLPWPPVEGDAALAKVTTVWHCSCKGLSPE
ncbi:UNVERIFIED_CONTAM: hypothetical protein FKN15_069150 [Acipenser sinensis]